MPRLTTSCALETEGQVKKTQSFKVQLELNRALDFQVSSSKDHHSRHGRKNIKAGGRGRVLYGCLLQG